MIKKGKERKACVACVRPLWKILFFFWLWMQRIIPCHYLHSTSIPIKIQTSLLSSGHPHIQPKSSFYCHVTVMDTLIRQMRKRSHAGGRSEPEDRDNINRVSSQRTRSSGESWFQRQNSNQMNSNNNNHALGRENEIDIAIAAVAYAINSLDEPDHEADTTRSNSSLTRAHSKKEKITQQGPDNSSKSLSGQQESSSKGIQDSSSKEQKNQPKSINIGDGPVKTVQKRPTFAEKLLLDRTDSGNAKPQPQQQLQEEAVDKDEEGPPIPLRKPKKRTALPPPPPPPSPSPPKFPAIKPGDPPLFEIQGQAKEKPSVPRLPATELANLRPKRLVGAGDVGGGASEADAWERDEMARIKVKHEKLSGTIVTWEDDKKKAARRKLDEKEREIERRRAKALNEYRTEMERIGQIAGGAMAQAEERRRNEELKAKERADRIRRRMGKARSNACFCF